jgi:hypothetical protein
MGRRAARTRRRPARLAPALLLVAGCTLAACGRGQPAVAPTPTRPPPPTPDLVAVVTLVGSGPAAGTGDGVRMVDLTPLTLGHPVVARTVTVGT